MGGLVRTLLSPLGAAYGREMSRRNARYDRGRGVVTLDRPVVSVGNLSVGGTGKSPMVARAVRTLREGGFRPAVAMRGYGSSRAAHGTSDEADEYRALFPDLPVVAQPNRTAGLIDLFASEEGERVDAVVLDDGFQHRRLARQLDMVLLDCTRPPMDDALLPAGRLREPMSALSRAQAVILTHAESVDAAEVERVRRAALGVRPGLLACVAEHVWAGLDVSGEAGGPGEAGVGWLSGKRVLGVCAIGNPGPFLRELSRQAGSVAGQVRLRDHDPFRPGTVARVCQAARGLDAIVCTAKDWSKLRHVEAGLWPCPVVRPRLELRLREGGAELDAMVLRAAGLGAE